jgi:hypothetical protein
MSWSLRRAALTAFLTATILGTVALGRQFPVRKVEDKAVKKEAPAGKEEKDDFGDMSAISLPRDNKLKSQIEAAVDYIKEEDWVLATEILQKLVGIREDVFAKLRRKTPEGKETEVWTSVRAEANRLIVLSIDLRTQSVRDAQRGQGHQQARNPRPHHATLPPHRRRRGGD